MVTKCCILFAAQDCAVRSTCVNATELPTKLIPFNAHFAAIMLEALGTQFFIFSVCAGGYCTPCFVSMIASGIVFG